jgi:hypothetical protein
MFVKNLTSPKVSKLRIGKSVTLLCMWRQQNWFGCTMKPNVSYKTWKKLNEKIAIEE